MKEQNAILDKSMAFAVRIVRLYRYLCEEKREYVLSKQLLRSGTSIGANAREAVYGYSREDFAAKLQISLKEASETEYWLELLWKTDLLEERAYQSLQQDCGEIAKILTAILKSTRSSIS